MGHEYFEELRLVLLVVHYRIFLYDVNLNDSPWVAGQIVQKVFKLSNIRCLEFAYAIDLNVKVSSKVMNVSGYGVSICIYTKQPDDRFFF
jgi:hypothetical protein